MTKHITIIDYGMGNLRSVQKACERINVKVSISSDPAEILQAEKLLLPGVGHFANGVKKLKNKKIWDALNQKVLVDKTPILGICLGMQLMANHSEEGDIDGLGWFDARVIKFKVSDRLKYKVPHIGWNNLLLNKDNLLFNTLDAKSLYYFVHSYHIKCADDDDILASTIYDYSFTSSINKDNMFGTQFHPEKSNDTGQVLLRNFIEFI